MEFIAKRECQEQGREEQTAIVVEILNANHLEVESANEQSPTTNAIKHFYIYLYQDKIKHREKRDNVLVEVRNRTLRGNFSFRRNFLVPVVPVVVVPASRLVVVAPVLPAALVAVRVVAVPVARREPLVRLFSFNHILFNCIDLFFFFKLNSSIIKFFRDILKQTQFRSKSSSLLFSSS